MASNPRRREILTITAVTTLKYLMLAVLGMPAFREWFLF
jgi:hypothetical protein